jgi:hypothetical protein
MTPQIGFVHPARQLKMMVPPKDGGMQKKRIGRDAQLAHTLAAIFPIHKTRKQYFTLHLSVIEQ